MTTPFKTELEQKTIDLLKSSADFDGIAVFYRGGAGPFVPQQNYPFAEVSVGLADEDSPTRGSTGFDYYVYEATVIFNEQMTDNPTVVDRVAVVPSHDRVAVWAQAAVLLFRGKPTLDDFLSEDELEAVVMTDVSAPAFFIGPGRARQDNFENESRVDLRVHTQRRKV